MGKHRVGSSLPCPSRRGPVTSDGAGADPPEGPQVGSLRHPAPPKSSWRQKPLHSLHRLGRRQRNDVALAEQPRCLCPCATPSTMQKTAGCVVHHRRRSIRGMTALYIHSFIHSFMRLDITHCSLSRTVVVDTQADLSSHLVPSSIFRFLGAIVRPLPGLIKASRGCNVREGLFLMGENAFAAWMSVGAAWPSRMRQAIPPDCTSGQCHRLPRRRSSWLV